MRSGADRPAEDRDSRQRAESHRAGHRVRLLLLSRRLRLPRRRLRDGDGQLQPGDRLDRLRHRRSSVLRAADLRRRDGGHRARARGQSRRRRASCSSAGRRRSSWRWRCRRRASRFSAPRPTRSISRRIGSASRSCCGISAFRSRRAARRPHAARRARSRPKIGFPVVVRPSYVLGGRNMAIVYDVGHARSLHGDRGRRVARPADPDRSLPRAREGARRRLRRRRRPARSSSAA